MSVVRSVFRFLYDFIVGDDWKVATGVVLSLAAGLALLQAGLPPSVGAVGTGGLIAAAFVAAMVMDVRRGRE